MKELPSQAGQTLIILLVFMIMTVTLTTAAVAVVLNNSITAQHLEEGAEALEISESGAENAVIRLVRDTAYTGETLTLGDGSVTVSVSGTTTKTVVARSTVGNATRTTTVTVAIVNGVVTVQSWNEN